jgi:hypothetical protein
MAVVIFQRTGQGRGIVKGARRQKSFNFQFRIDSCIKAAKELQNQTAVINDGRIALFGLADFRFHVQAMMFLARSPQNPGGFGFQVTGLAVHFARP